LSYERDEKRELATDPADFHRLSDVVLPCSYFVLVPK